MEEIKYWIWLSRIEGLGCVRKNKLLKIFKTPQNIWRLAYEDIININGFGESIANEILKTEYRENLDRYIEYMNKNNIKLVNIVDKEYPEKLRNIYDPPITLYVKGNIDLLNTCSIGIVGCRDCSTYGKNVAESFSYNLASKNITIISGMARGIDTFAHIGALKASEKTIAVLGSGLDIIYPKENVKLYNNIVKNDGLIISEYIIGKEPSKMTFPARNRIVSALSDGILVVEAKEKSGTLITVDFALEQGKNVFVIPGNITSEKSFGTNDLIKQGARCVTCYNDILEEINKY